MFKKTTLGVLAALLVGGFLFGSKGVTYLSTAVHQVRAAAQDAVPVEFQIEAAKEQLSKINPEIKDMVWQIAKEKAQIKRLNSEMVVQEATMKKRYDQMMVLRNHLDSGEDYYVTTNGTAYTNARVKEDLGNRFSVYKTTKQTLEKSRQIFEVRTKAMETALTKLEQAKSTQRDLQVAIENLTARQRMIDVAKTASHIHIDNSQLSRTQQMIDEISARLATDEEMMQLAPQHLGQIPVGEEAEDYGNVLEEMDAYFGQSDDSTGVVQN